MVDAQFMRPTTYRLDVAQVAQRQVSQPGIDPSGRAPIARWEQGRSSPPEAAAALILMAQKYPDTFDRRASL